jgi:hypothetical protein
MAGLAPARTLTDEQAFAVADHYSRGEGTIHGFAAMFDVSISTIKQTLDEYGVPHGKFSGNKNLHANTLLIERVVRGLPSFQRMERRRRIYQPRRRRYAQ